MSSLILSVIATVANAFIKAKYESIVSTSGQPTNVKLNSEHMKGMIAIAFIAVYEHEKKYPLSTEEDRKGVFLQSVVDTYGTFKPVKKDGSVIPAAQWEISYREKPKFLKGFVGKHILENGEIDDTDEALVNDYSSAGYTAGKQQLTFTAQQNHRIVKFILGLDSQTEESEVEASSDDDVCAEECPELSESEVDECDVKNFKL